MGGVGDNLDTGNGNGGGPVVRSYDLHICTLRIEMGYCAPPRHTLVVAVASHSINNMHALTSDTPPFGFSSSLRLPSAISVSSQPSS